MEKKSITKIILCLCLCLLVACSKGGDSFTDEPVQPKPQEPPTPQVKPEDKNDTIAVRFSYSLDVKVEDLAISRAENDGGDLIGVNVYKGNRYDTGIKYAAATFDDVSKMVFKLVKGQTYTFCVRYVPNAKSYVYKYPNGSYGMPFRNFHFDTYNAYLPNEIYYDDGYREGAYIGPLLYLLDDCKYQTTSNGDTNFAKYLNLISYYGEIIVKVDENTNTINIPLNLCRIGITLNVDNFTEGKIIFTGFTDDKYTYEPGGNNHFEFECPGYAQDREWGHRLMLKMFYESKDGTTYIIGTKEFKYEYKKNYVFDIDLKNHQDGTVVLSLPPDNGYENENVELE
ncbi:MAG: hypothetical protein NC411_08350 [Bacteroides sp.]|nr:hypothetical protein [Bacteroides sp.]